MVMARLSSWFLVVVLVQVTDLSVLAHVTFPSDSSLKISLPEWQPADRPSRAADWKHSRTQYGQARRGPGDMESLDKCPDFQLMTPCQCRERTSGLDITCENVETAQLESVTKNMMKYKEQQDFTVRVSPVSTDTNEKFLIPPSCPQCSHQTFKYLTDF